MMTQRINFYFGLLLVMGLMIGCQVKHPVTLTPTTIIEVEPTAMAERPSSTATATITPASTASPIPTDTAVPANTRTPRPSATYTSSPFPTSTTSPLPQALPTTATWTSIGTAVPPAAGIITTENVTALTEVARWGKGSIINATYSPDGNQLYVLTPQGLYVYETSTAQQLAYRPYTYPTRSMALSSDGQTIAVLMQNNYIELRDTVNNIFISAFSPFVDTNTYIHQIDFDQSGEFLFIRASDQVIVWDITRATSVAQLGDVGTYAFASQAALVATNSEGDDVVKLWQWQDEAFTLFTELEIPESLDEDDWSYILTISPNGDYVALGDLYLSIAVWQVADGQLLHILDERRVNSQGKRLSTPAILSGPGRHYISDLQFSPDSQLLAEATGFQNLTLWQVTEGKPLQELAEVGDKVIFKPDNMTVGAWNYTLSQWHIEDGSFINVFNQHIGYITDLEPVPNRGQLAIASADRFIYLRQLNNGGLVTSLRASENNNNSYFFPSARAIDVTANGNTLVSASHDAYRVWNLNDNSMIRLLPIGERGGQNIIISFDGKYVIGQEEEFGPPLFMWQTDKENEFTETSLYAPSGLAFSPTDLLLATTTITDRFNHVVRFVLWQPDTDVAQELLLDLGIENQSMGAVGFSPDGRYLAASTGDNSRVLIWTINNLEAEFMQVIDDFWPLHPRDSINGLAFSPDNSLLALKLNNAVAILDVSNGRLLHTLSIPISGDHVLFSVDGRYLITGHSDGSVRFWAVPSR